ncbi:MAG: general secretion pathway protein GspK, partial [Rhodanobacteraceae bacterium]
MKQRQRGTALLLVLWVTMLLAALLVGVAAASRSQSEAALYGAERVRAELAADAGLAHAVAGLRAPDAGQHWVPDGRAYRFDFDGARVTVRVVDVGGLVDLNAASPELIRRVFETAGAGPSQAGQYADTIAAWRGVGAGMAAQNLASLSTRRGASATSSARGPFRAIEQLARLPGIDATLYARVAPAVTVYSGRNFPDASYAGALVLASLRGIGVAQAETLVDGRRRRPAQRGAGNGQAFGAVANGPLVAGYGGVVERVFSSAEMP